MVKILKPTYDGIIKHAESGYPNEVCGVLIGKNGKITEFKDCRNLNGERARDRYELDPVSFQEADDWARENKMEIIGIYHSHPDHPSIPSEFDRARAWPDWVYIIFSIDTGKYNDARAWLLDDFDSIFQERKIELILD
ncbi:MAG: M67 family metallopeptidase [Thermodesulfobacteriota bacterium]